ncbi:GAF domain-containing sensor histidine kinase [Rhodobacteraceae bacterium]|nr:GAF domain-containing sensor histidine kinase [Paracoccaceae bacterium]
MIRQHDFQDDIDAISRNSAIPTLLETITLATGMGFVAIARVTQSRWITCQALDHIDFGLKPGDELEVESTLCHEVRLYQEEVVIDDVEVDPIYVNHHCPARYGFRSYVSVPIYCTDGSFFGTLCAIDPQPRTLKNDRILRMFRLFAKLIGDALDADQTLATVEGELHEEREMAEVQEQFIAILAHDLRNPISALTSGLRMIERLGVDDRALAIVGLMRGSVNRMGLLIENLLDQARKRSGGGIVIDRAPSHDLAPALSQVIAELQAVAPKQPFETQIDLPVAVNCDVARVTQLFSNLLSNAVTHGTQNEPIRICAAMEEDTFVLSVANSGEKIADDVLPVLFLPFKHQGAHASHNGLGLGLFIASEIAKGHGGTLEVDTTDARTVFTFRMPQ